MNETAAAMLLERSPHEATRAVVETLGQEAPRALYRAFDAYNVQFFGSALGAPLLFITQTASPRALGDYTARDVQGLRSRIRIAPKAMPRGERFAMDVLLHEMVHAWQSEQDDDLEPGYRGHGPRFAAKCNEIGAVLGLAPVGVKGRDGLPDCAQWPMCVRPEDYYPPRKLAKAPSARRAAGRDKEERGEGGESRLSQFRCALEEAVSIVDDISKAQREALGLEAWLREVRDLLADE